MDTALLLIKESSLSETIKVFLTHNNIMNFNDLVNVLDNNDVKIPLQYIATLANFVKNVKIIINSRDKDEMKKYFSDENVNEFFFGLSFDLEDTIDDKDKEISYDELMSVLGFSVRTAHCLAKMKLNTINSILGLTNDRLYSIRGMGAKSVQEVLDYQKRFFDSKFGIGFSDSEVERVDDESFNLFLTYVNVTDSMMSARSYNALMSQGLYTLYEVKKCDLNNLKSIGKKSINEINNVLLKYKDIYNYRGFDNTILEDFGLKFKTYDGFENTMYSKYSDIALKEIHSMFLLDLDKIIKFETEKSFNTFMFFFNLFNQKQININERIAELLNKSHIDSKKIQLSIDRGNGITLENLGKIYGVTRERIRQIDAKTTGKLVNIYKMLRLKVYFDDMNIINLDLNLTSIDEQYYKLFASKLDVLDSYKKIIVDDKTFFVKNSTYSDCESALLNFLINKINLEFDELDIYDYPYELKKYVLVNNDYEIFGTKVSLKRTKRFYLEDYLKKHTIVDLSDVNAEIVLRELKDDYNLEFDSVSAVVRSLEDVAAHSLGNKKYTHINNNPIMTTDIKNELLNYIELKRRVTAQELVKRFGNEIENLLSPTHLYSYLKKNYSDLFSFGGTNLKIAVIGEAVSDAELVYNYLQTAKRPIERSELIVNLNLSAVALNIIDGQNEDIFKYGKSKLYLKSFLIFSDNDINIINDYLSRMRDFYPRDLMGYLSIKNKQLLLNNYITDENELISLINEFSSCNFKVFNFDKEHNKYVKIQTKTDFVHESDFEI